MITCAVESFVDAWPEMQPHLPRHHAELALYQDRMELDVDVQRYFGWEHDGSLIFLAMRDAGVLVGYFVGLIGTSPHYQSTLMAKMDVLWVEPEHRGLGVGKLMMNTLMAELKRRGVKLVWLGSKNHKPIEFLFEQSGFERSETYFSQWIGD